MAVEAGPVQSLTINTTMRVSRGMSVIEEHCVIHKDIVRKLSSSEELVEYTKM